jgi:hypothetical protein
MAGPNETQGESVAPEGHAGEPQDNHWGTAGTEHGNAAGGTGNEVSAASEGASAASPPSTHSRELEAPAGSEHKPFVNWSSAPSPEPAPSAPPPEE